ncbi:MAG: HU family DNA-binding protein [Paracoccaceae bacterium]
MATSTKKKTPAPRRTSTTAAKPPAVQSAAAKKPTPKPNPAPDPNVVSIVEPVVNGPDLRKKELLDMVVERSDVKKKYAKPAVEAALAILGECIAEGRELNLPPLGKLRINRSTEHHNGRVTVCKIRQSNGTPSSATDKDDDEPLAGE